MPRPIRRGFEFRNVSFAYPGTTRRVLSNFNFTLEPGERIALIGENGQGKTTVVKLITRLYDPTEGQILLDGVDLREYKLEDLHHEIGVIFQDFMRYEMTARENISVGRVESEHSQTRRSSTAAHKSLAESVIAKLPGGYDQMLGRRFESGVELSGGEWQRVALARAYLRDAQLLVLDEPTAALDARSELEVFRTLRRTHHRKDGAADLAPLFDRAHGGPHRSARGRKTGGRGNPSAADRAWRALRKYVRNAGGKLPLISNRS